MPAAPSLDGLRDAVRAWDAYRRHVVTASDEAAQLQIVAQLRRNLGQCGVLGEGGFWDLILEQVEDGML